jgi:outer membrane protein TolC
MIRMRVADNQRAQRLADLQAEEDLFPAELNLAALRANLYISMVVIYKSMGGGWVDDAATLTAAAPSNLRIVQ